MDIITEYEIKQLSNRELLSLTLREKPDSPALNELDGYLNNPRELVNCSVEELSRLKGISRQKALQLKASLELGKRIYTAPEQPLPVIKSPQDAADLIMPDMRYLTQEHFRILLLNRKNKLIAIETISIGSLYSAIVEPRECFKPAIKKSAAAMILAHNHPSGDPAPSKEDIEISKKLIEAGELLGISILDHIIIGDDKWVSLKSLGVI